MSLYFYKSNPLSLLSIFFGFVLLCFVLFFAWPHIAFAGHIPTITLDDPPSLLDCSGATSQVHLSWSSDMHGTPDYFILRKPVGTPTHTQIAGPISTLSYIDNTAGSGTNYEYQIRGEQGSNITFSNGISVIAEYCASVLAAPVASCATDGPHIDLNWTAISGNLNTYEIYRDDVKIGDTTNTSFDDNLGVQGTVSYSYYIRAVWEDGTSKKSNIPPSVDALACPVTLSTASQCLVASPGGSSINLSWNSLLGVQEYQIYRQAPGDPSHSLLQGGLGATSFADNLVDSLSASYFQSGTISYYIKAIWPSSDQSDSTFQQIAIPQCGPFLSVTTNCQNKEFQLSWTGTQDASHYNVYRDDGFVPPQVSHPSFIFNDGTPDVATRKYRVDAIAGATTLSSNEITVSIDCTVTQPPSPDPILSQPVAMCSAGDSQISLSWTPSSNVNYYSVYRSDPLTSPQEIALPTATSHVDDGIQAGTDYTYYIIAFGQGGTQSNPSSALTESAVSCVAPTQPSLNVSDQCVAGDPEATISWTSDNTNTLSYSILRSDDGGATFPLTIGTFSPSDPEYSSKIFVDLGVVPSITYHYKVVARGPLGVSPVDSNIDSVTTSACLPTTPTNLTLQNACVSGAPRVNVSWTTNQANTDHYEVFRDGSLESPPLGAAITSWQDSGVVASTPYTYRVDAIGPTGAISPSSNQSITTNDCSVPGSFTLSLDQAPQCVGSYLRADLSWGASSNATSYNLTRSNGVSETLSNVSSAFVDIGLGKALDFDGSNDYVNIGNILSGGASQLSVEAWVYAEGFGDDRVVAKSSETSTNNPNYIFSLNVSGGRIGLRLTGTSWFPGPTIVLNRWYHIGFTYDGSMLRLYRDGVEVASTSKSGAIPASNVIGAIGNNDVGLNNRYFDGSIDEVRIYNRGLSGAEMLDHFQGIYDDTDPTIVGLWHLDEGSGQTASDSSNFGNNGTLVNGPTWVESGIQYGDDYTWEAEAFGPGGSTFSDNIVGPAAAPAVCEPPKPGLVLTPICEPGIGPAIQASWSYSINANTYELYREEGAIDTLIAPVVSQTSDPAFRVGIDNNSGAGLSPLTSYSYYVRSVGSAGTQTSDTISTTSFQCVLPTQPQNVQATFECSPEKTGVLGGTTSVEATDPGWTSGQLGGALDFNETEGDYVIVAEPGLPTGDFAYAAWVNLDETSDEMIAMASNGNGGNEFLLYVASGNLRIYLDGSQEAISAGTISTGVWTHVAATRSGSTVQLYINGVPDGSGTEGSVLSFSSCPLFLGADVDSGCTGGLSNFLDGRIDDVRIYNRALTGSEIDEVRLNTFADTRNLTAYWKFDEAIGQIVSTNMLGFDPVGQVTWEDSDNATSYTVYRDDGATFSPITDDDSIVYVYDDDTIAVDTAYTYTVQAFGPGGSSPMSDPSDPSIGVGNYCRPYFPTINSVGSACVSSIPENTVTWSDISTSNTTDYNIYRTVTDNAPDNPTDLITTVPVGTSIYLDNAGLSDLTTYYYWVEAIGSDGMSLSPAKPVTTLGCGIVPGTPNDLAVTANQCVVGIPQITLDWSDTSSALLYNVYRDGVLTYSRVPSVFVDNGIAFQENFAGTSGTPWPTDWVVEGAGHTYTIENNRGRVERNSSNGWSIAYLNNVGNFQDFEILSTVFYNTNCANPGHIGRRQDSDPDTYYYTQWTGCNSSNLVLDKIVDGARTNLGVFNFGLFNGVDHKMRTRVEQNGAGTDLRVKLWPVGTQEPASWTIEVLGDTEPKLQNVSGRVGVLASLWVSNGRRIEFDDFEVSHIPSTILQENQPYTYTVTAVGVGGESGHSNPVSPTAVSCTPEDPNLTVVPDCSTGGSALKLVWCGDDSVTFCPNTDYWDIFKTLGGACIPADDTFLYNAPQTSRIDVNVQSGATYDYCARGGGAGGSGLLSLATATAPFCANLPYDGDPADIMLGVSPQCSGSNSRIVIDWDVDVTGNTVTYNLLRQDDPAGGGAFASIASGLSSLTLSHTDTTITLLNDYVYRLEAVGSGPASTIFMDSLQITALDCENTPPQPPSLTLNVVVSKGVNPQSVSVSWTDASNEYDDPDLVNKAGYRVFREGSPNQLIASIQGGNAASYSFVDNTAQDNTLYKYQVRAYNDNTNSYIDSSNLGGIFSNILDVPVPIALPGNFTMSGTTAANEIQLTWTAAPVTVAGTPVTYTVERDDSQSFSSPTPLCVTTGLTCDDTSPDLAESWYRVVATNAGGLTTVQEAKQFLVTLFPQKWREISPF